MNFEWKNYIRSNLPELLRDIDTRNGLEGVLRQHSVLPAMTVTRIWSIKDEIRRVSELLDQIQKGDTERYKKFCAALAASDQQHIVDQYLTKCVAKDSTDAAPYQLENPLSKQLQKKLCENWNDIIASLESSDELISELVKSKVFTDLQIRKLKGLEVEFERSEQIVRYLEKTSQEKFQRFCDALHTTGQGHLVSVFYGSPSEGSKIMNEVVEQTTKLTIEESTPEVRTAQPECRSVEQPVISTTQPVNDPDDAAVKVVSHLCPSKQSSLLPQYTNSQPVVVQGGDLQSSDPHRGTSVELQPEQVRRPSQDVIRKWREEIRTHKAYDIFYDDGSQKKRGVALIVANIDFSKSSPPLESRTGTDVDIGMLTELLSYLKFDIHLYRDLTAQQIPEVCRTECNNMWCEATVYIVFILSHGAADAVFGTDGKPVKIEDLVTIFDGKHCSKLVGKPKLFFIQACQGTLKTMGVDMSDSGDELIRHEKADIMQVFSSYPGFVSFRNTTTGSYFIQFIREVFMSNAHENHVSDMMNMVAQKVNAAHMDGTYKQTCQVKSSADKHIYLFPY